MMEAGVAHLKFDPSKLEKLNDPARFESLQPDVMWGALGSPQPGIVVDIGAGTGLFAAKWVELAPGATVYAVDTEPTMLEWMRQNRPEVRTGAIVPVAGSEIHVPLDDGSAELVTMVNLHHELAHPEAMYCEAERLLACGGQLLVVDWAPVESPKGPPVAVRVSAERAERFVRAAGFSDVRSHAGLPYHWVVTATKR